MRQWTIEWGQGVTGPGLETHEKVPVIEYSAYKEIQDELKDQTQRMLNLRSDWLEAREEIKLLNAIIRYANIILEKHLMGFALEDWRCEVDKLSKLCRPPRTNK